jgi:hypothetical protein
MTVDSSPSDIDQLHPARNPWRGKLVHWKDRSTWFEPLGEWLQPYFRKGAFARLGRLGEQDLCWDDSDWLDIILAPRLKIEIDTTIEWLADALDATTLRAFHGCRVADAGVFVRNGIRLNDPAWLEAEVRRIVAEEDDLAWLRPTIEQEIARFDARERDTGRLYVCADDQPQLDRIGHYMLYGSEWVTALLGFPAHSILRGRGVPTMVELDLPFRLATPGTRREFARKLLQEWVRVLANSPTFVPKLDFTVILRTDVPAHMIVGHYHPEALKDPFRQYVTYQTQTRTCPACA